MKIEIKSSKLNAAAINLPELVNVIQQELLNTSHRLQSNIGKGLDSDGGRLKGYSESYKAAIRAGHVPGKPPGREGKTDLTITRAMLNSMQVQKEAHGATLSFLGGHPAAPRRTGTRRQGNARVTGRASSRVRTARGSASTRSKSGSLSSRGPSRGASARRSRGATVKQGRVGSGGGGSSVSNAQLASYLYGMGFTNWFALSKAHDIPRIEKAVGALVDSWLKKL